MRRILVWILLAPIATLALLFAVANRRWIAVSFDPFSQDAPAYAVDLPLFIVIFVSLILGVFLGGIAVWFGRLRWRLAAHRAEREAARLKAEKAAAEERAQVAGFDTSRSIVPPGDRIATG
jgi:uncharacterized integral membrane protein